MGSMVNGKSAKEVVESEYLPIQDDEQIKSMNMPDVVKNADEAYETLNSMYGEVNGWRPDSFENNKANSLKAADNFNK